MRKEVTSSMNILLITLAVLAVVAPTVASAKWQKKEEEDK